MQKKRSIVKAQGPLPREWRSGLRGGDDVWHRRCVSARIHPTAIIDPAAQIGEGCEIGPYCVIGPDVELGPECWLQHHVSVSGPSKIGRGNRFFAFSSIGQQTQDLKYAGEPTYLAVGDGNTFREFVTVHRGTAPGSITRIGNGGNFLAYSPHRARLHRRQRRHLFQQRHARRPRRSRRSRHHRRAHGDPSVLPHRRLRAHRRLLEDRAGRAALHDRRRQSGQGPQLQQGGPRAARLFRGDAPRRSRKPTASSTAPRSISSKPSSRFAAICRKPRKSRNWSPSSPAARAGLSSKRGMVEAASCRFARDDQRRPFRQAESTCSEGMQSYRGAIPCW